MLEPTTSNTPAWPASSQRAASSNGKAAPPYESRAAQLAQLRRALGDSLGKTDSRQLPTGFPALDQQLPQGGYRPGWLVEWLTEPGAGGALLSLVATYRGFQTTGYPALVVVDTEGGFYPPAVVSWGIPLETLLIIRPRTAAQSLWVWEELLRSRVFPVVWGTVPPLSTRWFRRLQLACEAGSGWGVLVRSLQQPHQPTWSAVQWRVAPYCSRIGASLLERRWQVFLLRCPGRPYSPDDYPTVELDLHGQLEERLDDDF